MMLLNTLIRNEFLSAHWQKSRKRQLSRDTKCIRSQFIEKAIFCKKEVFEAIFLLKGKSDALRERIAIASKTGDWTDVLSTGRKHLIVYGFGQNQLIPSLRSIRETSSRLLKTFLALCKPDPTISSFRVSFVNMVKIHYFLRYNHMNLSGLRVDICVDGVQIGKVDQTRLVFRILGCTNLSAQSVQSVMGFATFSGI